MEEFCCAIQDGGDQVQRTWEPGNKLLLSGAKEAEEARVAREQKKFENDRSG